jgi:hypothetical protein
LRQSARNDEAFWGRRPGVLRKIGQLVRDGSAASILLKLEEEHSMRDAKAALFWPPLNVLHNSYTKQRRLDQEAALVSASSVEIEAPVEAVWAVIVALRDWRTWAPGVEMPDLAEVAPDISFRWRLNGVPILSTIGVVDLGRELNWTGAFLWFRAVERYVLEPLGPTRTRVTLGESMAGAVLPLFYSSRRMQAKHERWLAAFKRRVELEGQK